jgi:hypothetical protein
MLRQVHRAVPRSWTVIVLADRGLYARWLFRRITRLGWHPFLRINLGGTFRPTGQVRGVPLKTLVPEQGATWQGTGIAFTLIGSRALAAYDDVDGPSAANNRLWSRKCTATLFRRSDASARVRGCGGTRSVRLAGAGSVG